MKRRVVLFVFVLSIMFLVASCASNKTKEVEVVEIAEEPVIEHALWQFQIVVSAFG